MKYLQDDSGRVIPLPDSVQVFKRVVVFTNFAIAGDFSSDFEVPNNSETRSILSIYGLNQVNKLIQKPFHFFIDGNIISDGRIFIRGVADTIDLFFVAGNGNWMNQITGSLKDLDLSAYDLPFDAATVISRMGATEGVIFPVMDWNSNYRKLSNTFHVQPINGVGVDSFYDFYACVYAKTILKTLINSYGYILSGNLLDDAVYNSLVITAEEIQSAIYEAKLNPSTAFVQSMSGTGPAPGTGGAFTKMRMQTGTSFFDDANDRLVFPSDLTSISLTYEWTRAATDGSGERNLQLRKNGVTIDSSNIGSGINTFSKTLNIPVTAGDYFEMFSDHRGYIITLSAVFNGTLQSDGVVVSTVLPQIDQIDFIKYIAQRFNCLIDFNENTQTLTFTTLDSIRKEDAVDFTSKLTGYTYIPASGYKEKNYIRTTEADELSTYKVNNLNYGDALVESDGDGQQDVLKTPLRPAETFANQNIDWLVTSVPLVRLTDADTGRDFSSVSNSGGNAVFNGGADLAEILANEVFRVESPLYNGIAVNQSVGATSVTPFSVPFSATTTGKIYKQNINFLGAGARELIVCRDLDVNDINTGSAVYGSINLKVNDETGTYPISSIAWAFHAKPNIGTDLDKIRVGLNYGPVAGTDNIPFGSIFHRNLKKIIKGPHLKATVLLSQVDFLNLNLKRFVYLITKEASGYFFISDFSDGYTDQFTPVTMDLVYMDNG